MAEPTLPEKSAGAFCRRTQQKRTRNRDINGGKKKKGGGCFLNEKG